MPPPCACADPALCRPLDTPPRAEVLMWQVEPTNWPHYNLSVVTTIAAFGGSMDPAMLCAAHASGVKVAAAAPFPVDQLLNATYTATWIADTVAYVATTGVDGVNFDVEDPLTAGSPEVAALTALVAATTAALRALNPVLTVSADVAWSPADIDGRGYDYAGLAAACDYLAVMAYDMRSQVFPPAPCVASANAPMPLIRAGLAAFGALGIAPSKLVLGVPWYGYTYECVNVTDPQAVVCPIKSVPFRGCNCSDAAGGQLAFSDMMALARRNATTPVRWDRTLLAPYFNTVGADGVVRQQWFDDPESLSFKYALVRSAGLGGVAVWNVDEVSYAGGDPVAAADTAAMWAAIATVRD